ncbi:telomere repeat-binding protein 2-like isoform X4 [Trifolium pratense]|uniref:Uncharacterized protein n=1 Tax=Trifolium pratense TaxID=57577 RepID=A0ACB0KX18_TRIPR|nr:telomere repeat-binding protein 2-like isoform X4 [Trifolium pratense]XP_045804175.1 telomere repeat-binding protein 2-like isoform X4 [Trifolium pratense]CAJ2660882.1 unnamed protein product [Trifolium pratense]
MVAQNRINYGFNGYQVPKKPRAARSPRKRDTLQRSVENDRMCAIDLLATVAAGTLLQEKQNPIIPSDGSPKKDQHGFVKEEDEDANTPFKAELPNEASCDKRLQHGFVKEACADANKPLKAELSDDGSSEKKCFSTLSSQVYDPNFCSKENLHHPEIDGQSCIASIVTSSSCSERFVTDNMVDRKSHSEMKNITSKVELGSSGYPDCNDCNLDVHVSIVKDEVQNSEKVPIGTSVGMCCFEDPVDEKPQVPVNLGGNAKLSGYEDSTPHNSLFKGCDNVTVVGRDDDENFSGCSHPSSKTKTFRSKTCIGDQRIRKRLASKYRKVARESKHDTLSNNVDRNFNTVYSNRKNSYKRQLSQMNIPFKKRKIFDCSSTSNSNGYIRNDNTYYSTKNDMNQGVSCSSARIRKDPGMSSLEGYHRSALRSRDSHVKLRIKSFRVPELFIEIPETATVASLKIAVMEAVTTLLRGGLRVGMILNGKKLRDDSKTLLQTGISHDNALDALGFTLEPNSSQSLPLTCAKDSLHVPSADMPLSLIGQPSSPAVVRPIQRIQGFCDTEHQVTSLSNIVESEHDSAPSPISTIGEKRLTDSKELVTIPEMDTEGLAVLPVEQKPKRTEMSQRRRIRRPFSVAEVEALVEAVERLGTGRWRDVKLRAFDDAKHRTYVDLKDKWKTLVHTARISPQQRRGEPVPQELLDRVLTAHAYWSQQQQTKQHQLKHHPETCLLL